MRIPSFSFIFNPILVFPYPIIKELKIYACDFSITRKYNCICEKHLKSLMKDPTGKYTGL